MRFYVYVIRWPINRSKVGSPPSPTHTLLWFLTHSFHSYPVQREKKRCVLTSLAITASRYPWLCLATLSLHAQLKRQGKGKKRRSHTQDSLLGQFFLYRNQTVVFSQPLTTTQTSQFDIAHAQPNGLRERRMGTTLRGRHFNGQRAQTCDCAPPRGRKEIDRGECVLVLVWCKHTTMAKLFMISVQQKMERLEKGSRHVCWNTWAEHSGMHYQLWLRM